MDNENRVFYTCSKCGAKYYFTGKVANEKEWLCSKCRPFKLSSKYKILILLVLTILIGCVRCFFVYPLEKIFLIIVITHLSICCLWAFRMLEPSYRSGYWVEKATKRFIRTATTEELNPEWAKEQRNIKSQIQTVGFLKYIFGLLKTWLFLGVVLSFLIGAFFGWKSIIATLIK